MEREGGAAAHPVMTRGKMAVPVTTNAEPVIAVPVAEIPIKATLSQHHALVFVCVSYQHLPASVSLLPCSAVNHRVSALPPSRKHVLHYI